MKSHTPSVAALNYGRTELPIPDEFAGAQVVAPPELAGVPDLRAELREVLNKPAGSAPLSEFVEKGDVVTLVVSDITRPSGAREVLPVILEEISHAGQVRILVALGLHRRLEKSELVQLLGERVANSTPTFQHDARALGRLIFLGRTRYGTEVQVSRFLLPEDAYRGKDIACKRRPAKLVLTGTISPHYFFGFSGGRKSILPGCASKHAIRQNHALVLGEKGERVPECRAGNLAGNPCHLDSLEAAQMVCDAFVVNTVHAGATRAAAVVAGGLEEAHLAGCRFFLDRCAVALGERFDVVLASCGGYPRDLNFIQSHKAIEYAFAAVRPKGTLVLAAECADGFGSRDFFKWFRYRELPAFWDALQRKYEVYGQTAYATLWKAKKVDIVLVSGLAPDDVRQMGMIPARGLEEAGELVRAKYGERFSGCIMPYASDTLVRDKSLGLQ